MDTWQPAYINNKRSKCFAYGKLGLYVIRETESKIIRYIGMSKFNIVEACYRHFYNWDDVPQRVVYSNRDKYEIRVIILPRHLVDQYEQRLIRYFKPTDNHEFYDDTITENISVQPEFIPENELEEAPF